MPSDKEYQDAAEVFHAVYKAKGVATMKVEQGHMIMISRAKLQKMLDDDPNKDGFILLIQEHDIKDMS
jgi:hypothetical protein